MNRNQTRKTFVFRLATTIANISTGDIPNIHCCFRQRQTISNSRCPNFSLAMMEPRWLLIKVLKECLQNLIWIYPFLTRVCLSAAVYVDQAALVEFDIEEELAEKFSRILPSALLLIVLPFMVLRLIGKLIILAILITFSFGRCWSLSLWAGLCSWNGTVPLFITRWLQFSCLRCLELLSPSRNQF